MGDEINSADKHIGEGKPKWDGKRQQNPSGLQNQIIKDIKSKNKPKYKYNVD